MRLLRLVFALMVLVLSAGGLYAHWLVGDRAARKQALLQTNGAGVTGDAVRGEYVAAMGGCIACHTNSADGGELLAGGVPIATPFGTFYSPNITSDKASGIGSWKIDEFLMAMTIGLSPAGEHYYPAFPYPSYSAMTVQDLIDLKAWLDTVDPVATESLRHNIKWPVSGRGALVFWKAFYFNALRTIDTGDRGDYLVNGPGHCAECHASRLLSGGLSDRRLTGNANGPDGESVPGISLHDLVDWTEEDLALFLEVGMTPSGDFTGGHMADVIEYGTGRLSEEDRLAISRYLLSGASN